ncbi:MAG: glutathione ABC transporter permease GsiC [Thiotrichales bacterium 32-46-8]|nr:MAG: glutathione ABC transporter permease GsiC [Thiotrichales bacterium 32-46-8]OYY24569.1 MAG: glutathione ABC transporter permease GsiC [Thiotrichales bacterium 35-46-9]OYZ42112.1 MAG: glutathione ABC transporter permease GsiC [Thiotrichales bacterium 24-47-4]OZA18312.1 MAG: glutathione ABC transporter permease GsiC [Thiotrichales bacterium 17-46-47]OZB87125.1 MAG: glutathione ABC transporter permease GsiC [Thiotrichales bacterium 12-47-6]HQR95559.1 ABC transporter permease [Thiotrichales
MMANIARQLLGMLAVIWVVITAVFLLLHLAPGDPIGIMLGDSVGMDESALRQRFGLDLSLWHQYWAFLAGILRGDWGMSIFYHKPVLELLWARLPATLTLALLAVAIALLIALPLGIIAAVRKNAWQDKLAMITALVGMSIPGFVLGPILIIVLAVDHGWFPVSGMDAPYAWVLPALTLGTALAAILTRMLRASLLEVLHEDYIRTAKAKGASESRLLLVHGLRNAFLPILTLVGLQLGALLGGAVIIETVFDWPGLGLLLIESINRRDYALVLGAILLITLFYVLVNNLLELAYRWLDPRIRSTGGRE